MVTVVYRFESSIESKPSATARATSFVVTSSHTQTKHLSCHFRPEDRKGLAAAQPSPVTEPTASTPAGRSLGTKIARDGSYSTRAPACASSEYDGCRPAVATSRSQSTGCPSRRTDADAALAPLRLELRERRGPQVDDARHRDSGLAQLVRDLELPLVGREDDRAGPRA